MQIGESVILVKGRLHHPHMDQYLGKTVKVHRQSDTESDMFNADPSDVPPWAKGAMWYWEYAPCKAEYDRQMAASRPTGIPSATAAGALAYSGHPIVWDQVYPSTNGKNVIRSDSGPVCQHDLIPSALSHGQLWCRKCGYKPSEAVTRV